MTNKYEWLEKKNLRSVDQLRLWAENPRLNPEEKHYSLSDFAEDLTSDPSDKDSFYDLIKSIVKDGFVPADPIVVWKNEDNNKLYIAEGNRRVTALKLLRDPNKAPKSIRNFIRNESKKIDPSTIEKIYVNIAPTFDDAEWYINQRNSASSLQRKWSRTQQQRWITTLYEKYEGNIDKVLSVTSMNKSELEGFIRILKIKDLVHQPEVRDLLNQDEFNKVNSHKFPITILERLFNFSQCREEWGIEYNGTEVIISSNKQSFYKLFAVLLQKIVNDSDTKINTRITKNDLPRILESLPKVEFDENTEDLTITPNLSEAKDNSEIEDNNNPDVDINDIKTNWKGNPDRNRIVLDVYNLTTDSYRLLGLFEELKKIPMKYQNVLAASLRVFLDLSVFKYIETEGLKEDLQKKYNDDIKNIQLKKRLEYLKINKLNNKEKNIVSRLLDPSTEFSLDVLNGYIHSNDSHYIDKKFLNKFWDFLFPLFQLLLDIRESK